LSSPLFVTPVSYPNNICIFLVLHREKVCYIGGFMEGPNPLYAKSVRIDSADCVTEGENSIQLRQIYCKDFFWVRVGAVVRVVKKGAKTISGFARQNSVDQRRGIPLVNQDDVRLAQLLVEKAA